MSAYVGLGSNLADPLAQVQCALRALAAKPGVQRVVASPWYRSAPLGPSEQPDYINGVARLDIDLSPHALLDALQAIESAQGRVRGAQRWGPRTLDLDLLLYGTLQMHDTRLTLPHPGLHERAFVLYPLRDIAPALDIPGQGPLSALIERCAAGELQRLDA